jgi:hypothetical protein
MNLQIRTEFREMSKKNTNCVALFNEIVFKMGFDSLGMDWDDMLPVWMGEV